MKKTIQSSAISILLLFVGLSSNAQFKPEKYATYYNSYLGKSYDIKAYKMDSVYASILGYYELLIDAFSLDLDTRNGGIMIGEKKLPNFIDALNEAKAKYEEWLKVAKENGVKDVAKQMNINNIYLSGYFFKYGELHLTDANNLSFHFKVKEINGKINYTLLILTGELKSTHSYVTHKGFCLTFNSANEIDTFIDLISPQKVKEFVNRPKPEDLFKD